MSAADYSHARPFDTAFYAAATAAAGTAAVRQETVIDAPGVHVLEVSAGEVLTVELLEGPQIVNLFLVNPHDPDERYWGHQTWIIDSLFLTRGNRLWGTMARLRPLMTILQDSVTLRRRPGGITGKHHVAVGGAGTPALWREQGGDPAAITTWEQLGAGLESRGWERSLLKDNACLFQKTAVDQFSHRFLIEPSDAVAGDTISLLAEIDLVAIIALSPYVDGGRAPHELVGVAPRSVAARISEPVTTPLSWPYPGVGYPDLGLYLDSDGVRSDTATPTPGR